MKTNTQNQIPGDTYPENEDGVSPKELAKLQLSESRKRSRGKPNHHAQQLCKQARYAIDEALICDCGDPILEGLQVETVRPVSGTNQLEVLLSVPSSKTERIGEILEALKQVRGILRSAVAGTVHRKNAPQLAFTILPVSDREE